MYSYMTSDRNLCLAFGSMAINNEALNINFEQRYIINKRIKSVWKNIHVKNHRTWRWC